MSVVVAELSVVVGN